VCFWKTKKQISDFFTKSSHISKWCKTHKIQTTHGKIWQIITLPSFFFVFTLGFGGWKLRRKRYMNLFIIRNQNQSILGQNCCWKTTRILLSAFRQFVRLLGFSGTCGTAVNPTSCRFRCQCPNHRARYPTKPCLKILYPLMYQIKIYFLEIYHSNVVAMAVVVD